MNSKRYIYSGSVEEWDIVRVICQFKVSEFKLSVLDCHTDRWSSAEEYC